MEEMNNNKLFNAGLVVVVTMVTMKLILVFIKPKSQKRLPPVIKARPPLIGGLLKFFKGPIAMLREEYPKLGSVFTLKLLHKNITFLIGPEVTGHFFNAPECDLSQQEAYRFSIPIFGPGVLWDVNYPVRKEQFGFSLESLQASKLKLYVDQMVAETKDFFSNWGESGEVDLKTEMNRLIMLTSTRTILGKEVRDKFFNDVSALFDDLANGMQPIGVLFPYAPISAHRCRDRARKRIGEIVSRVIAYRKARGKSENDHDILQFLIDSKYKDGRPLTDEEITGLLVGFIFGGKQSSAITSTWTGVYLLTYKEYLSEVLAEQKSIINKYGDNINYDVLSDMDVLPRCIKEALRLQPPVVLLLRQAHSDFSITTRDGKQYDIPKGYMVGTSPVLVNRLPYVYKNPDSYDPDRFNPSRNEDKLAGKLSYTAFGGGRHYCHGEQFVYRELMTVWSILLRNFELELISPFPETDWNAMVPGVKGSVMVRYKRKNLNVD